MERVDVNDLLTRTVQLMQKYLQNAGVRVTADLGEIPPCVANANAMRQILLNLITNAVQAMPNVGELFLRTSRSVNDRVHLEVRDTGMGIADTHLRDIFNPFYTTKAPGHGTGLGLSLVPFILHHHRGRHRVAGQVGVGTTFTIGLPALPRRCQEANPALTSPRHAHPARRGTAEQRTLAKNLERAGYLGRARAAGEAALARLGSVNPTSSHRSRCR